MKSSADRRRDLAVGSVGRHLRRIAAPAAMGFLFGTLFNIVDTFYAGMISTEAQAGLAFSFPVFFVMLSFAVGLSRATTAMVGMALGMRRRSRARGVAGQAAVVALAVTALLMATVLPSVETLLGWLGADGEELRMAALYTTVIYYAAPFFVAKLYFAGLLNGAGDPRPYRNAVIGGTLANVVLDPALMFGWLGLPALGLAGIAWASLIVFALTCAYLVWALRGTVFLERWRPAYYRPRPRMVAHVVSQATAPTVNMLAIGVCFSVLIGFLAEIDPKAVAGYGIALRLEQVALLALTGLNVALLAVASRNYGANNLSRVGVSYRTTLRYGHMVSAAGAAAFLVLGIPLLWLFNPDPEVIRAGYLYLVCAAASVPLYNTILACNSVLQSVERPAFIAWSSALRLVVLPPPLIWLFVSALGWGVAGVWAGYFLSNLVATAVLVPKVSLELRRVRELSRRGGMAARLNPA